MERREVSAVEKFYCFSFQSQTGRNSTGDYGDRHGDMLFHSFSTSIELFGVACVCVRRGVAFAPLSYSNDFWPCSGGAFADAKRADMRSNLTFYNYKRQT